MVTRRRNRKSNRKKGRKQTRQSIQSRRRRRSSQSRRRRRPAQSRRRRRVKGGESALKRYRERQRLHHELKELDEAYNMTDNNAILEAKFKDAHEKWRKEVKRGEIMDKKDAEDKEAAWQKVGAEGQRNQAIDEGYY